MSAYRNPVPGSFLLPVLWHTLSLLYGYLFLSILRRLAGYFGWTWLHTKLSWQADTEHLGIGALELYCVTWPLVIGTLLFAGVRSPILLVLAVYRLYDIAVAVCYAIFCEPQVTVDKNGCPAVHVKHPSRWIAATMIQGVDLIINFAVIRIFVGNIADPVKAFYYSLCSTVFNPVEKLQEVVPWLDSVQILYSLLFFLVVLPVTINSIRIVLPGKQQEPEPATPASQGPEAAGLALDSNTRDDQRDDCSCLTGGDPKFG